MPFITDVLAREVLDSRGTQLSKLKFTQKAERSTRWRVPGA